MLPSELSSLPFESLGVPEKYVRKAEQELNETPDGKIEVIKELRALVAADKTLEELVGRKDEKYLMFLRAKKFDLQRTYENLKYYISYKKQFNFLFNHSSADLLKTEVIDWLTFLPFRCPDGCAILLFKMDNWNASETSLKEIQRFYTFFLWAAISDPMTQISGFKFIVDFRGSYMKYIRCLTPTSVNLSYNGTINCLPGRLKGFHIIFPQLPFKICYSIVKPFLPEKIKSRIFFHDNFDTLLQYFPKEVLPEEYGGSIKEYSNREWIRKNSTPEKLDQIFL